MDRLIVEGILGKVPLIFHTDTFKFTEFSYCRRESVRGWPSGGEDWYFHGKFMSLTQCSEKLAIAFAGGPLHNLLTRWPGGKAAPFAEITCAAGGSVLYSSAICRNWLWVLEQQAGHNRIVGELATHAAEWCYVLFAVRFRASIWQVAEWASGAYRKLRRRGKCSG